jgi:hypothetical protein
MNVLAFNRDQSKSGSGRSRFDAIAPLVELSEIPMVLRFPHLFPDGRRANSWGDAVAWCATKAALSTRSIWRIYSRFKKGGIGSLSQKPRRDKGTSRFFAHHVKAASFAAYLHLSRKAGAPAIHRAILENCAIVEIEDAAPSKETVRTFLKITPMPTLIGLALNGQEIFRSLAAGYAKRGCFGKKGKRRL